MDKWMGLGEHGGANLDWALTSMAICLLLSANASALFFNSNVKDGFMEDQMSSHFLLLSCIQWYQLETLLLCPWQSHAAGFGWWVVLFCSWPVVDVCTEDWCGFFFSPGVLNLRGLGAEITGGGPRAQQLLTEPIIILFSYEPKWLNRLILHFFLTLDSLKRAKSNFNEAYCTILFNSSAFWFCLQICYRHKHYNSTTLKYIFLYMMYVDTTLRLCILDCFYDCHSQWIFILTIILNLYSSICSNINGGLYCWLFWWSICQMCKSCVYGVEHICADVRRCHRRKPVNMPVYFSKLSCL